MASPEQVESALRKADAAGDTAGAKVLANELRTMRSGTTPPSSSFKEIGKDIMASTDWAGMRRLGYGLAPAIAPTVGAVAASPFMGPMAGAVFGGLAGEGFNNLIGLTQPSVSSYATQGLLPPALKGVASLKRLGSAFGEKGGAETLNRMAAPEIRELLKQYQPPNSAEQLFGKLIGRGSNIPVQPYVQAIEKVKPQIALSSPGYQRSYGGLKKNLQGSEQDITYDTQTRQPVLPISKFQREMHDVGTHTQAAEPMERGAYKQLYGGLAKSLDQAALPGSQGAVLKEAREAFKRESVLKDIANLAKPFTMSGQGDVERFSANKIINRLKDPEDELAKFYRQSFTPDEQASLMKSLVNLNKIPPISAPRGTDAGSKERLGQIAGIIGMGGAGGAIGHAGEMGAEGAGIGAAAGYLIPKIHTMVTNYNIANNTTTGKALIKELWQGNGGKFSPQFWSALEAFAASQAANPNAELFKMVGTK